MHEQDLFCACSVPAAIVAELYDIATGKALDREPVKVGCDYEDCVHRARAVSQAKAFARQLNDARGRSVAAVRLVSPDESLAFGIDRYQNASEGRLSLLINGLRSHSPASPERIERGATVDLRRVDVARVQRVKRFPEELALVGPAPREPKREAPPPRCRCGAVAATVFELYDRLTGGLLEPKVANGVAIVRATCSSTCPSGHETALDAQREARDLPAELRALPVAASVAFGVERARNASERPIAFVLARRRYIVGPGEEVDIPRRLAPAAYGRGGPLEPVLAFCQCGKPAAVHFQIRVGEEICRGVPHLGCADGTCTRRLSALVDASARAKSAGATVHVVELAPEAAAEIAA